jgi:DNA-binding IclR family transcriptional regulator
VLQCLKHKGFVNKSENGRYSLSLRLFELAWMHPPTERLMHEAQPVMQWLAGQTQQACYLSVLHEGFVSVIAEASPPCGIGFCVKPGATVNLTDAAGGYVILAYQSKDVIDQIVADWQRSTGQQAPSNLRSRFTRIQERGFEESSSPEVRGVIDVSFPIRDLNGSAVAALTISYVRRTNGRSRIDQVRTLLSEASEKISVAIGGGPFPCALQPPIKHD